MKQTIIKFLKALMERAADIKELQHVIIEDDLAPFLIVPSEQYTKVKVYCDLYVQMGMLKPKYRVWADSEGVVLISTDRDEVCKWLLEN